MIPDCTVDLMVTSPPYPMIEMWDNIFAKQNRSIREALNAGDGSRAFELMHKELDKVWIEVNRVLKEGGFACINVGDATRTIRGEFRLYANHSRILERCLELGFRPLPEILWRKLTNVPNKFIGSGMLPPGAYVTLEHEFILILRKGSKREFSEKEKINRQRSAYFWEERNLWFSDIWENLSGTKQNNIDKDIRSRSGAYPFELPYRLINMFSLREDTVLDPFLGTGTTTLASMVTGRNSIGLEIDPNLKEHILLRFSGVVDFANQLIENRLKNHMLFVEERIKNQEMPKHLNRHYGFPVMATQETEISFDELNKIEIEDNGILEIEYREEPTFSFSNNRIERKGKVSLDHWT